MGSNSYHANLIISYSGDLPINPKHGPCARSLYPDVVCGGTAADPPRRASQCNVSLKKQRSRSILSSFFCCFRDYNVEAPPGSSPSVLPPLVEENGGLQKVSADAELAPPRICPVLDEHP
ncbi:hypothetical protein J1605_009976 [Eschrichtius robustus]|uniref:Uncharacterized protein n=1 Tax=Eschrichtius robustus TaxID=9764 RepID=A0AB34GQ66_ESCRO|nr:hypothetical protein J1605_009976 [Eschrichtius robustus]